MPIAIRFGSIDDRSDVESRDPHIPAYVLAWKLEHREVVLAMDGEELVGYLRLEYLWSKYPYIGLIKVHPDYRGKGIGTEILHFVEEHLKQQGVAAIYSSSQVNESRPQEWHRKMGFSECGILNGINEGGIGELFFVKTIQGES